jgi:hypothetical protein
MVESLVGKCRGAVEGVGRRDILRYAQDDSKNRQRQGVVSAMGVEVEKRISPLRCGQKREQLRSK